MAAALLKAVPLRQQVHWSERIAHVALILVALTLLASVPVEPLLDVSPTALPLMKSWPITRIFRPIT